MILKKLEDFGNWIVNHFAVFFFRFCCVFCHVSWSRCSQTASKCNASGHCSAFPQALMAELKLKMLAVRPVPGEDNTQPMWRWWFSDNPERLQTSDVPPCVFQILSTWLPCIEFPAKRRFTISQSVIIASSHAANFSHALMHVLYEITSARKLCLVSSKRHQRGFAKIYTYWKHIVCWWFQPTHLKNMRKSNWIIISPRK